MADAPPTLPSSASSKPDEARPRGACPRCRQTTAAVKWSNGRRRCRECGHAVSAVEPRRRAGHE